MSDISLHFNNLILAHELAIRYAKPNIIEALTDLKSTEAKKLIKQVTGVQQIRAGQIPSSTRFFVRSPAVRLHASVVGHFYTHLLKAGFDKGYSLLSSYRSYEDIFEERFLDINQAYALVRMLYHAGALTLCECNICHALFVADPLEVTDSASDCPFHKGIFPFSRGAAVQPLGNTVDSQKCALFAENSGCPQNDIQKKSPVIAGGSQLVLF